MLLILAACRKGIRPSERIAKATDLSIAAVKSTLTSAIQFGLIDRFGHLTQSGVDGLKLAESIDTLSKRSRIQDFYFPESLRGGPVPV
jgi:hypothetical protein